MSALPSENRHRRLAGIGVAVLLVALAFYSGTLAHPYETGQDSLQYRHAVVPETSAAYDEDIRPVYQYEELSPTAQTFVDRTRAAPDDEYTPAVCQEFVLVCDTYTREDLPREFRYGAQLRYGEGLYFIEQGDDRFLFETGSTFHGIPFVPVRVLSAWTTMLPLAGAVAVVAFRSADERTLAGAVGVGVVAAAVGVLAPYVEMAGVVSAQALRILLVSAVWTGLLAVGGARLYRLATASGAEAD